MPPPRKEPPLGFGRTGRFKGVFRLVKMKLRGTVQMPVVVAAVTVAVAPRNCCVRLMMVITVARVVKMPETARSELQARIGGRRKTIGV